ncbi:MAG: hypothetical protein O7A06_08790, partial [Acidobacteria bacterium]|nr:hypothetical protein [Acidobacteriota bacterium]
AARDRANKRRDLIVKYLVEAYRRLESCSNRESGDYNLTPLESTIADIQLFGSSKQCRLAQEFASTFTAEGCASLDDLLAALRQDLRAELSLDPTPDDLKYLRIVKEHKRGA